MDDMISADDRKFLSDPKFRQHMAQKAHAAFIDAGQTLEPVKAAFNLLLPATGNADGVVALEAFRRLCRTMQAFQCLSAADREVLAGIVISGMRGKVPAYYDRAEHGRQLALIYASNADLAAVAADLQEAHAATVERAAQQRAAYDAQTAAAKQRQADAPGIILEMHVRGIRLDVDKDGRARAFPVSKMTDAERGFLATHNAEMAVAIQAEWLTA